MRKHRNAVPSRNSNRIVCAACAAALWFAALTPRAPAADWPQFRGPERNGISAETGLLKAWPDAGPRLLWSATGLGDGYAAPAIVDGVVYVTGVKEKKEFVAAFDAAGKRKWETQYGGAWTRSFPPARTTPTVLDDALFVISGMGEVVRLNTRSGKIEWSVDAKKQFGGTTGPWGTAESPLIVEGKVIYTPGGEQTTMVALAADSGDLVWKSPSLQDKSAYVSPILIEHNEQRMIVGMTGDYVFAADPADGRLLWQVKYADQSPPTRGGHINCNSPVFHDGRLFVTSGYNHVGMMLELQAAGAPTVKWTTPDLDTHHGNVVLVGGHLYGTNWINNKQGNWVCVDWQTGETTYDHSWCTKGAVTFADGMLYCYEEKGGTLALVPASPDGFRVTSSFKITMGSKQHWGHPAISDGRLFVRHGEALMVFDIRE